MTSTDFFTTKGSSLQPSVEEQCPSRNCSVALGAGIGGAGGSGLATIDGQSHVSSTESHLRAPGTLLTKALASVGEVSSGILPSDARSSLPGQQQLPDEYASLAGRRQVQWWSCLRG